MTKNILERLIFLFVLCFAMVPSYAQSTVFNCHSAFSRTKTDIDLQQPTFVVEATSKILRLQHTFTALGDHEAEQLKRIDRKFDSMQRAIEEGFKAQQQIGTPQAKQSNRPSSTASGDHEAERSKGIVGYLRGILKKYKERQEARAREASQAEQLKRVDRSFERRFDSMQRAIEKGFKAQQQIRTLKTKQSNRPSSCEKDGWVQYSSPELDRIRERKRKRKRGLCGIPGEELFR